MKLHEVPVLIRSMLALMNLCSCCYMQQEQKFISYCSYAFEILYGNL